MAHKVDSELQSARHLAMEPGRTWRWVRLVPRHQAGRFRFLFNLSLFFWCRLKGASGVRGLGLQSRDNRVQVRNKPLVNHQADRCSFFRRFEDFRRACKNVSIQDLVPPFGGLAWLWKQGSKQASQPWSQGFGEPVQYAPQAGLLAQKQQESP